MKPILGISFPDDPADALRAFEMLKANFRCEFEFASLYDVEEHQPGDNGDTRLGWSLRQTQAAHDAFNQVTAEAREGLLRQEAGGLVPTAARGQNSRPNPNEYNVYCRLARELLAEDRPGGEEGRRVLALKLVGAFNDRLREEGLLDLLVTTSTTRKLYNALRASVPGIRIESGVRTYVSGVDWTEEAKRAHTLPPFRAPYS